MIYRKAWRLAVTASMMGFTVFHLPTRAWGGVIPGDTYDIAVLGFASSGSGSYLTFPVDATFGTTQSYSGRTVNSQVLTISSNEVVGPLTTTDNFSISVPTNFDPTGTTVGSGADAGAVTELQVELGGYNAGFDSVDLSAPILTASGTGAVISGAGNTTTVLSPGVTPENGNITSGYSSYEAYEGVSEGGADLSTFGFHTFTFAIAYANPVPEPALTAVLATGALGWFRRPRCRARTP